MITSKINIKPHLCEYAIGRFGQNFENPVKFPDTSYLYFTIGDLMSVRPADKSRDFGNLEIVLPDRKEKGTDDNGQSIRKNPERFNYFSARSALIIEGQIETALYAELHTELDDGKHRHGIDFQDTIHTFICRYQIRSITEDALLKNYYRWRKKAQRRKEKRNYSRQS